MKSGSKDKLQLDNDGHAFKSYNLCRHMYIFLHLIELLKKGNNEFMNVCYVS